MLSCTESIIKNPKNPHLQLFEEQRAWDWWQKVAMTASWDGIVGGGTSSWVGGIIASGFVGTILWWDDICSAADWVWGGIVSLFDW